MYFWNLLKRIKLVKKVKNRFLYIRRKREKKYSFKVRKKQTLYWYEKLNEVTSHCLDIKVWYSGVICGILGLVFDILYQKQTGGYRMRTGQKMLINPSPFFSLSWLNLISKWCIRVSALWWLWYKGWFKKKRLRKS